MPSNLLTADTKFPQIDDNKSDKENLNNVVNYLYMLLEQLRYTLGNLDTENFNDTALEEFVNIITEPVYIQLKDDEENIANLMVQADSFSTRLQDAENNVSTLTQTSNALAIRIQDAEGTINNLSLTANSLTSQIASLDGSVSMLSQTVNGLSLSVKNNGTSSQITLLSNGIQLSSESISLTGYVTFSALSTPGETTIYGGNISTSSLKVSYLYGENVYFCDWSGNIAASFTLTGAASTTQQKLYLTTGAFETYASGGSIYLRSSLGPILQLGRATTTGPAICKLSGAPFVVGDETFGRSLPTASAYGQVFFLY